MFTVCIFAFASLFAERPTDVKCMEDVTQAALDAARTECAAINKDPFHTCEVNRISDSKYAVIVRKLDGV